MTLKLQGFVRWREDDFRERTEKQEECDGVIDEDAEEIECVREGLLTFETGWLFPVWDWVRY